MATPDAKRAKQLKGLLGMGNPLLDISANVDMATVEKYGLKMGNAVLAEESHMPLYAELEKSDSCEYIPGGATQNSIRVAQWMAQEKGFAAYMGAVGKDEYAAKMRKACDDAGVNANYMETDTPTGSCGVLINGTERSLCANLSAANCYDVSHLEDAKNWQLVEDAKVYYSAGFFATVSPKAIAKVREHALEAKKIYCFNLAAPFLMEVPPFRAVYDETMPYVDFLFGNESEALTYAKTSNWDTEDITEIAKKLSELPKKGDRPRTVVITQGSEQTVIAVQGKAESVAVEKVSGIVDTNGAGDVFVGGFLSRLVKGADVKACVLAGHYSAGVVICHSGCTYPAAPDYKN